MIGDRIKKIRKAQTPKLSQEEFGEMLGVSRSVIANAEVGRVDPSSLFIQHLCAVFGVDEKWLRTGEGEPFKQLARKEAIAKFAGELMKDEEDSFRSKLVELLAELNEDEWAMLERFVDKLTKKADQD